LAAAFWILGHLGQGGSVLLAASMNVAIGASIIGFHLLRGRAA
jgi:hypothetical protein